MPEKIFVSSPRSNYDIRMEDMTFRALFEHSSLGIIITNEDGDIERCNPYAAKIFGYDAEELTGKKVEVLIPPHLAERHIKYRQQYNRNPIPRAMGSNLNLLAVRKNNEPFPVEISLSYFDTPTGRKNVSFINDITIRKQTEDALRKLTEELETKVTERTKELSDALLELGHTNAQIRTTLEREKELNELKSRFVSMASHEFRTPLAGILTSVALIAKYPKTEEEDKREKHIQNIKKSVRNLTNILNDFLSTDKLDQGKVTTNPIQFNLNQFLDEMVCELKETSDRTHNIEVAHEVHGINLFQDKEMIRNVVTNLLSNAIKYSSVGSPISIKLSATEFQASIVVSDQGMGISEEDQKHLFERFFRAANVTNLQGTGLGLNIVKRYLDLMGGKISVRSKVNEGTSFKVDLPRECK